MSKDSLTVVRSNGDCEPFLRGIMTRTLTEQGVSFEKAYLITKEVKKKLNRRRQITSTDLGSLLEKYLEQKYPRLQRNPVKSELPQLWVHSGESRYPFSKGMLSQSITSAGISPGKAYLISRQIEQDLILLGKMEIKSEELTQMVRQQLQAQFSPDIARTYEVASRINDLPHPVILYVAGAPGTGKSTLAQALASRLGILNVVGTDSIREVMRLSFSKEIVPTLHASSFEAGSQLVFDEKRASQERVIAGFVLQSQQVCVGIRAMVRRAIAEGTNLLIEGVHLLPFLVKMPEFDGQAYHIPLLLRLQEGEDHMNRFRIRGKLQQRRAEKHYLKHFEEIRTVHEYYHQHSQQFDLDQVDNVELDQTIQQSLQIVLSNLQEQLTN